jgi:hypothetical protein
MTYNQTQIPVLIHPDPVVTQLQQNVNRVLRNIASNSSSTPTPSTAIGEVKSAFLTESQFQSQMGTNWVLCDGRSVTGSAFAALFGSSTLPDMRATVPRMKDNGANLNPDGDLPLGSYESDAYQSHTHIQTRTTATSGGSGLVGTSSSGSGNAATSNVTEASGGNETRAKSTTINFFIRIN